MPRVARHHRARLARLGAAPWPSRWPAWTRLRLADGTTWLHVLCDADLTCYRLGGRGEVWTDYAGIAVHDRFAAYGTRQPRVRAHALCNAHRLRNLQEIVELEEEPHGWAARLQRLLHEARRCARGFRMVTGGPVQRLAETWEAILQPALDRYERLPPLHRGKRRGHNLALALRPAPGGLPALPDRPRHPLLPQPGRAGPAHDAPADEDLGLFPDPGGGPPLCRHAQPHRDRPQAGTRPPDGPAADRTPALTACRLGHPVRPLHQYLNIVTFWELGQFWSLL